MDNRSNVKSQWLYFRPIDENIFLLALFPKTNFAKLCSDQANSETKEHFVDVIFHFFKHAVYIFAAIIFPLFSYNY